MLWITLPKKIDESLCQENPPLPIQRRRFGMRMILPIQKDGCGKWMPNYEGPFVVKRAFSGGALILTNMDGEKLSQPVNADRVKKYYA